MRTLLRREDGQAAVLAAVTMVALLGMAGFVIDVGSWFRQQRGTQATADAAALAGAQALPTDPGAAQSLAASYAAKNGGGGTGTTITISSHFTSNDMITVKQTETTQGFFSRLFGINTVDVGAKASAVAEVPTAVNGVAPIGVSLKHPMLSGSGCPCFDQPTSIPLGKVGVPGGFMLLDLTNANGAIGSSTLADWIQHGYQSYLPLGDYDSDTGAKFASSSIQAALQTRYQTDLLFPVYDQVSGNGSNAQYQIVGWASFHLTNETASGNSGQLYGYFDRVIWDGIVSAKGPSNPPIPDLGVYSVALID